MDDNFYQHLRQSWAARPVAIASPEWHKFRRLEMLEGLMPLYVVVVGGVLGWVLGPYLQHLR